MKSSVVIVNWNSGSRLKACLDSLQQQREIVVVDNASNDDSVSQAKAGDVRATFIENDSNRGFAAAVNQGFAATSSDYVLLLNPDVCVVPGSVERLEEILDRYPRTGAVGGAVNEKYLPRALATPWTVIRENCGLPVAPVDTAVVGQAAAAALLVRREAHRQVAGFDEKFYPAWYEDVDFCRSLRAAAWEIRYEREARFIHEGGYSARTMGTADFAAAYYHNQLRYIRKHFGTGAALLVRGSIAAGMAARALVSPSRAGAYSKVIAGALGRW